MSACHSFKVKDWVDLSVYLFIKKSKGDRTHMKKCFYFGSKVQLWERCREVSNKHKECQEAIKKLILIYLEEKLMDPLGFMVGKYTE